MKVYIFTDMEGISGISSSEFVRTDGRHYAEGRRYYTWDANACIRGCFEGGAAGVILRDGHGGGTHFLWDELDPRAEVVQGDSGSLRFPGINECQALILLGYHAMAGTAGALLEHSYSSAAIQNLWLNNRRVGEIGIDAAIAAEHNVPTVLVTGDDYACHEASEWIPGVSICVVKQGITLNGARLLPKEEAHRRIAAAAAAAVGAAAKTPLMQVSKPVTVRKEVIERGRLPSADRGNLKIVDGRTCEATDESVERAFFSVI